LLVVAVVVAFVLMGQGSGPQGDGWLQVHSGRVEARAIGVGELVAQGQQVLVSSEDGVVISVEHGVGDELKAGDILVKLGSPQLMAELESTSIEMRRLMLEGSSAVLRTAQEVEQASFAVAQAESAEAVADAELEMYRQLAGDGIVAKISYQQADARARQARLGRMAAQRLHEASVSQHQKQVELQEQNETLSRLEVERLQDRVDALQVVASGPSVLKSIAVRVGDAVAPGQVLAEVGPPTPDRARVRFPQRYVGMLRPGINVDLTVLGQTTRGRIVRVSSDLADGQVSTEVAVDEMPPNARIDMAVRAEAVLAEYEDVLYVNTGIEPNLEQGSLRVEVRSSDDPTAMAMVNLHGVIQVDGKLIISKGVSEGDMIRLEDRL